MLWCYKTVENISVTVCLDFAIIAVDRLDYKGLTHWMDSTKNASNKNFICLQTWPTNNQTRC